MEVFYKFAFRGTARNIYRFLFCINWIKSVVYHTTQPRILIYTLYSRVGGKFFTYWALKITFLMMSTVQRHPAQVKNLKMFLSSCWLNLENILAVLWKTNLEIFLATNLIVSNYSWKFSGSQFFLVIPTEELLLAININIFRLENAFL